MKKIAFEQKRLMVMALLNTLEYHDVHESEHGYEIYARHSSIEGSTRHRVPDYMFDNGAAFALAVDFGVQFIIHTDVVEVRTLGTSGGIITQYTPVNEHPDVYSAVRYGIVKILLVKLAPLVDAR